MRTHQEAMLYRCVVVLYLLSAVVVLTGVLWCVVGNRVAAGRACWWCVVGNWVAAAVRA